MPRHVKAEEPIITNSIQTISDFSVPEAYPFASVIIPNREPIWMWPMQGNISQYFGKTSFSWRYSGGVHTGLDIAAPRGTSIYAAYPGTVSWVGWKGGYGNLVIVKHGDIEVYYAHQSRILVRKGDELSAGDLIGLCGSTGWSTGNHLHIEVRVNGVAKNPLNYIS